MKQILFILLIVTLAFQPASYRLTVNVNGITPVKGDLYLALHIRPQYFNIPDSAFMKAKVKIDASSETYVFENVPPGKYALAVYQDENLNGKLDANELGMPKEGYALSGKPGPGKPKFDEAAFTVSGNQTLDLTMIYRNGQQPKK
jgi:uncharacterized protein (DUF2141 family)